MVKAACLSIIFSFFIVLPTYGASGFKGGVGLIHYSRDTDGNTLTKSESSVSEYNVKLGYLNSDIYYAVLLDSWSNSSATADASRSSTGLVIGYHGKAWYFDGTYFFSSDYKPNAGTTLKEGSGLGFDIGYNFLKDSTKYFVCFQMSYKSFEYKKANTAIEKNSLTEMMPMLVLGSTFAK